MKTTHVLLAALAAVALGSCGGEGAMAMDANRETGGAAGTAAVGTGGATPGGTGGAPAAGGAIGNTFTRADHDMCMSWPVCPDGVVSLVSQGVLFVRSQACGAAFDGNVMVCGSCVRPSSAPGCDPFVGRCIAPAATPTFTVAQNGTCSALLADFKPTKGWVLCTGIGYASGSATENTAEIVCKD